MGNDKPVNLICPECGGRMVSRLNKKSNSRFWGCVDFPKCKGTRDIEGKSRQDRENEYDRGWKDDRALDEDFDGRKY